MARASATMSASPVLMIASACSNSVIDPPARRATEPVADPSQAATVQR